MTSRTKAELKAYFNTGDKLTEINFSDFIDSVQYESFANVKDYGAIGDNSADDTSAFQSAINASTHLYVPAGTYKLTSELSLSNPIIIEGAGKTARLINDLSDLFQSDNLTYSQFKNFRADTSNGHIFNVKVLAYSQFSGLMLIQNGKDYSIYYQRPEAGCGYLDNTMHDCFLQGLQTHTVPLLLYNSNCNSNSWRDLRITNTGNYAFYFNNSLVDTFVYDNILERITGECVNGGFATILDGCNFTLRQCHFYDAQVIGDYLKDIIVLGASGFALGCYGTRFEAVSRRGDLAEGLLDIKITNGNYTTIDTCLNAPTTRILKVSASSGTNQNMVVVNSYYEEV
jgi:hypothetical protein